MASQLVVPCMYECPFVYRVVVVVLVVVVVAVGVYLLHVRVWMRGCVRASPGPARTKQTVSRCGHLVYLVQITQAAGE